MDQYLTHLKWLDGEKSNMVALLKSFAAIHSGTDNLEGLAKMLFTIKKAFSSLGGEKEDRVLPMRSGLSNDGVIFEPPLGKAISIKKHPQAKIKILLLGHMDIALKKDQTLEPLQEIDKETIIGRGTADMKGGLVIMLKALEALEKSPFSGHIGWHVLINPDEEIGSPGSRELIKEAAKDCNLALVFEPSLPNGALISSRKGSLNYSIGFKGKAAHSGRNFDQGASAISSLVRFASAAESLNSLGKDITVNIGYIKGGGLVNIVPDRAFLRLNARVINNQDFDKVKEKVEEIAKIENRRKDLEVTVHLDSYRSPKPFDKKTKRLFESLKNSAINLGVDLQWKASGGSTDGNIVAEFGLTTCDSLGIIGGKLHTKNEWANLDSLVDRAKLVARFLMQLAAGEIKGEML